MSLKNCLVSFLVALLAAGSLPADPRGCNYGCREERCKHEKLRQAHHFYLEGRTLARRGYYRAAVDVLEHATELAPSEGRYHLLLAKVLRDDGNPAGAVMHLRMARETGDAVVRAEAAELLSALRAPPEPEAAARSAPRARSKPGSTAKAGATKGAKALYDRLGGADAVKAVVDDFVARVGDDKRIASFFAMTNLRNLKARLVEQIGQATGGPEVYKGADMKSVHKGMNIKPEHFDALVEDLVATLDKFKVPAKEKGELLAILGPMKSDIVE